MRRLSLTPTWNQEEGKGKLSGNHQFTTFYFDGCPVTFSGHGMEAQLKQQEVTRTMQYIAVACGIDPTVEYILQTMTKRYFKQFLIDQHSTLILRRYGIYPIKLKMRLGYFPIF
jgi:hypothetical protein